MPFVNNPTKEEKARGEYRPRMTVKACMAGGRLQNLLRVEFSAPKMLYGNNLQELTETDLPRLVKLLKATIKAAGVFIPIRKIRRARVSAIHYSKNFILTDGTLPSMYLAELKRCDVPIRLNDTQSHYQNGGHGLKFRCNSYEIAFYDKISDLAQAKISPKRTVEGDDNLLQRGLYEHIEAVRCSGSNPYEVLRYEVRINKRQKLRSMLTIVGERVSAMHLTQLFSERISKAILLHHLHELEDRYPLSALGGQSESSWQLFCQMVVDNPDSKIGTILSLVGWSSLLKGFNSRELKGLLSAKRTRAWNRLMGEFKRLQSRSNRPPVFKILEQQLLDFKPVNGVETKQNLCGYRAKDIHL